MKMYSSISCILQDIPSQLTSM